MAILAIIFVLTWIILREAAIIYRRRTDQIDRLVDELRAARLEIAVLRNSPMVKERIESLVNHDADIKKCDKAAVQFAVSKAIMRLSICPEQVDRPEKLKPMLFFYISSYDNRLRHFDEELLSSLYLKATLETTPVFDNISKFRDSMVRSIPLVISDIEESRRLERGFKH